VFPLKTNAVTPAPRPVKQQAASLEAYTSARDAHAPVLHAYRQQDAMGARSNGGSGTSFLRRLGQKGAACTKTSGSRPQSSKLKAAAPWGSHQLHGERAVLRHICGVHLQEGQQAGPDAVRAGGDTEMLARRGAAPRRCAGALLLPHDCALWGWHRRPARVATGPPSSASAHCGAPPSQWRAAAASRPAPATHPHLQGHRRLAALERAEEAPQGVALARAPLDNLSSREVVLRPGREGGWVGGARLKGCSRLKGLSG
jgi:hypothetical protein